MAITITMTDGERMDAHASTAEYIVLVFGRDNVDKGLTGDALDRLLTLSDSPELVRRFEDRVSFVFDGYDVDPREIYEIPECVQFFRALDAKWPYWFHFIDKQPKAFGLIFRLALDYELFAVKGQKRGFALKDPEQLRRKMLGWFSGVNLLYATHEIAEERNVALTDRVVAAFERIFG